ncbi:MAG TPA: APC family permease [Pyrinomonadaceae bacterium]|nr:APC family permease [Pyrinomonadaceae bacterium]
MDIPVETLETTERPDPVDRGRLLRILGIGFGLAICIGSTVGQGILRTPGPVAENLGSVWLIMFAWMLGGVYCLLGANNIAELATMTPKAGGFFVYAHRAYGPYGGFVVGWGDWAYNALGLAFVAVVFGEYAVALFNTQFSGGRILFSVSILVLLTSLNWLGVRAGSVAQKLTSLLKAIALVAFVVACFLFGGKVEPATVVAPFAPLALTGSLVGFILAFQMILSTYDGWHSPIYFSEEDTNPTRNVPRALFGGILLVAAIYILVNAAIVYVLPLSQLAGSQFAGGDAITLMFGSRSGQIITLLALLSLIGILNAMLMFIPRIMFGLGRAGLFTSRATTVNPRGTPVFALGVTALTAIVLTAIGTFEMLLAISQFLAVSMVILLVGSLFVLRRKEPDAPRPYRVWGYPFAPGLMLIGGILLFVGYIYSNPIPSLYSIGLLILSYPLFRFVARQKHRE